MKKKYLFKLSVYILIILFTNSLFAQVANNSQKLLPNIVPPSPIAYNLGNYGNVPIGMFAGSLNLSVPLYTYKTTNLEVPITLFYSNNGIKVDEISSNVGQGWNLTFGGVISRIVRDEPDENRQSNFVPLGNNYTYAQKETFVESIADIDGVDSEMDLFSFNFGNYSGKFLYNYDNTLVLMPAQNIKVEKLIDGSGFSFIITTPDGIKYYFNNRETTLTPKTNNQLVTTAWYITKIVHPKGDEIYFNYISKKDTYILSKSQTLTMQSPAAQYDCNSNLVTYAPTFSTISEQRIDIFGQAIESITSNNSINGEIRFNYVVNNSADVIDGNKKIDEINIKKNTIDVIEKIKFSYFTTVNKRVFLNKLQYIDSNKNYQFEYINKDNFPERLSFSQDHWGYYNGKNNTNLIPKKTGLELDKVNYGGSDRDPDSTFAKIGMLSKIIYPTKGSTVFEYESNDYYGTKTITPGISVVSTGIDNTGPATKEITLTSAIDQEVLITAAVSFNAYACPDGDAGKTRATFRVKNTVTGSFEDLYIRINNGDLLQVGNSMLFGPGDSTEYVFLAKSNQTYTTSITLINFSQLMPQRSCTTATLNVSYIPSAPYTVQANLITGGIRVKSTSDYTNNTSIPIYKRYFYAAKDNLLKSSGNIGKTPLYIDTTLDNTYCDATTAHGPVSAYYIRKFINITSSSLTSLFDNGSSNVCYQYVTISIGNDAFINGAEQHKFQIYANAFNQIWGSLTIAGAPNDYGYLINGLPETISYFNSNNKIVNTITNQYENTLIKESKSYNVRKYYDNFGTIHIDDFGIPNISVVEYKNSSYWNYLKSKEETQYDLNGLNPIATTTNYVYNNPNHLQLSVQNTRSSSNELLETKYYYPLDSEIANEPFVSDLIAKNMINVPLKIETFKSLMKLSEQKTVFIKTADNLLVPGFVYGAKFPNSNPGPNQLEKKLTYNQYDNKGNILQYTPEGGSPVSIIWGYNQTLPIAKIENATNVQIATALGVLSVGVLNETNLSAIDALRTNASFTNSMISTYTYIPLIGINTITDPKGDKTTYTYDSFGRLQFVKDKNDYILSENQYNYKQ